MIAELFSKYYGVIMPIIKDNYKPPLFFRNSRLNTIFPVFFRIINGVKYERTRIETPDSDFIDLDVSSVGSDRAAIIIHGMEASSNDNSIKGIVKTLNRNSFDAVAMNLRGCSREPNRQVRFYNAGISEDVETVLQHVKNSYNYSSIALVGYSLGANILLKYLGEKGNKLIPELKKAAAIALPCSLRTCNEEIEKKANRIYLKRFVRQFHKKVKDKMKIMPEKIDDSKFEFIRNIKDYDDFYTAPLNGYRDAYDYWEKCSSLQFLENIKIPTLILSAKDDTFLAPDCYPYEIAKKSEFLFLETPEYGGHMGFVLFNRENETYADKRIIEFLN